MVTKYIRCKLFAIGMCGGILISADYASAQNFGTNTTPCPTHCGPASPWWGYVQTRWTRWPGATYPDMVKAPGTGNEDIPAPNVDLPTPSKESDLRTIPTTPNNKSQEPSPATEATPSDLPAEPSPAQPPETRQTEMPAIQDAPGVTPPEQPFFTPPSPAPSNNAPAIPPEPSKAPSGSSSALPKSKLYVPTPKLNAAYSNIHESHIVSQPKYEAVETVAMKPKNEAAETVVLKPLRLRLDADDFSQPTPANQEPGLVSPAPNSRQITVSVSDNSSASGNPLRSDYASAVIATSGNGANNDSRANYSNVAPSGSQPAYQR
jgi:hypothetical protein